MEGALGRTPYHFRDIQQGMLKAVDMFGGVLCCIVLTRPFNVSGSSEVVPLENVLHF